MTAPTPTVCPDAWTLYNRLGPWTQGDGALGWPLLLLCDAWASTLLQPVDNLVRDTPQGPGWSQLLDVTRCPTACLSWLGQFAGVTVDPTLSDAAQRAQVTAQRAEGRGTPAAIIAAAQQYLGAGQSVRVAERTTDAYHLGVTIYSRQLIGMTYGDIQTAYPTIPGFEAAYPNYSSFPTSSAEVTAAVLAAVPAGLICTVTITSTATYGDIQAAYPTQSGFQAAFSTWTAVAAWTPP